MRYRADQLFAAEVLVDEESLGWVSLLESETMEQDAAKMAESLKRKAAKQGSLKEVNLRLMMSCPRMARTCPFSRHRKTWFAHSTA